MMKDENEKKLELQLIVNIISSYSKLKNDG
jgi:hypothetical protein